ncbi:MAG: heparinase II/III family protein [Planctomycetes bacterium]|nr:heparinase II/III family protein [Planctomycetota bacterium]
MTHEGATNPEIVGLNRLQNVSYDPFGLMPERFPSRPRCLASGEEIDRIKQLIQENGWAKRGLERLLEAISEPLELPEDTDSGAEPSLCSNAARRALHLALAATLTGENEYREQALPVFRRIAELYLKTPVRDTGGRLMKYGLSECGFSSKLAWTCDLLATEGLDEEDDELFGKMLAATRETANAHGHVSCGNHNTWLDVGQLIVGAAIGDMQFIHDALYGYMAGDRFRYGLIHHLRHDILSDGLQWERTLGYHFYTLMGLTEVARQMELLGVDLWHAEIPAQMVSDGKDLHRAYGPEGETKCLKAAFNAPFYMMFPGGDFTMLHDSGVANIRGAYVWGIVYELAWEAYQDPKYAWLINKTDRDYGARDMPDLPMSLSASHGVADFVRLKRVTYPEGEFSMADDRTISVSGRLRNGCSFYPVSGQAVLRGAPDEAVPAAFLFWGPHIAGHQSPAALHLDLHSGRRRVTDTPRTEGYSDPMHLTWQRTTIAHNTVTVDGRPMFPYERGDEESLWWRDEERGRTSDGHLEAFLPDGPTRIVRASNEKVYPGVLLDRTVALERDYVLDVYRVLSEEEHCYDWAVHCVGEAPDVAPSEPIDLGDERGYQHLENTMKWTGSGMIPRFRWGEGEDAAFLSVLSPENALLIVADDPEPSDEKVHGELGSSRPRSAVILRAEGRELVFVVVWSFGSEGETVSASVERCDPAGEVVVVVEGQSFSRRLNLPMD